MRVRLPVAVLALVVLTAFAPAPLPRRAPRGDEPQRIQGAWLLVGQLRNDKLTPDTSGVQWVFFDGRLEIVDGNRKYFWETTVDPRATPRTLEMRYKPDGKQYSYLRAVYTIEGDRLTIGYYPGRWGERPKAINSKDTELLLSVYRRVGR